ncbi:hypothetical protein HN512_03050 [Candidatus Peregrinibacteria bacterium]|jgi:membrane protein YdbS with pleckstrin-like domain|nr:hypothetical protein [Candidatus Peregrinibacteria bacterium]MBT3598790.1 hypothetical protein [Candidatus Peregrinibacteria bacterium]MBT4367368.1 hypothetical protein [Candidatus Peregrinibacteria bacterium]MBT4585859.1 hypothetical protein [Candidatus Peregrinibacteria bacterium]MBT6731200.1 hypothetical protein [Candidatus Peregrinibacteria bacterium]
MKNLVKEWKSILPLLLLALALLSTAAFYTFKKWYLVAIAIVAIVFLIYSFFIFYRRNHLPIDKEKSE